jgi:hypothetical protein
VEVKRSSDGRIRREVIGQTLDYAANGVPALSVRADLRDSKSRAGPNYSGDDVAAFWSRVKTNLHCWDAFAWFL